MTVIGDGGKRARSSRIASSHSMVGACVGHRRLCLKEKHTDNERMDGSTNPLLTHEEKAFEYILPSQLRL